MSSRIATRYATPLLELATDQKVVDKVKDDIDVLLNLCSSNRDFVLMLESPVIPHLRKAAILKQIFSKKVNKLTLNFFDVVARKNREKFLPLIAKEFVRLYNEFKGFQEATVTTTVPLDKGLKAEFENVVKSISGKKPLLIEKIDTNLVGGYTLQMGDRKLDDSVNGHLRALKLKFKTQNNS